MVTISEFQLSKYAVTFDQYDIFCQVMGFDTPDDNGWGRGKRPVINVSWNDANNFAIWLRCRLPTESEWEYACRASTITPFNTGNNITINQANFDADVPYNGGPKEKPYGKTLPVGSLPPNLWGLYEMHGNVWEWCNDWHAAYPTSAQSNPVGPSNGEGRVVRGGSWNSDACKCRSAVRNFFMEDDNYLNTIGFRIARS
jgi:formylglycine-generating enzyme required for sulfatase activity